ncbi:MAG: U32 family peptidase [bacterium]
MKLTVATNFDGDYLRFLDDYPVEEVYGKLPDDPFGGGRVKSSLPNVSWDDLRSHVKQCHEQGIWFNYLLNAASTNNKEFTRRGQRQLEKLLRRLEGMGVEAFTVASPYFLNVLKEFNPEFYVKVSVFAQVGDVRKARHWENLGADEIVLDSMLVNREFDQLEDIRDGVSIPLTLLANNNCLYGCALSPYHMNVIAAGSRRESPTGGFLPDYCYLHCTAKKIDSPWKYLAADWIRPEDLDRYEDIGYRRFKLAGRNIATHLLKKRVKAYSNRRYDGNLLDLTQDFGEIDGDNKQVESSATGWWGWIKWLWKAAPLNLTELLRLFRLNKKQGFTRVPELPSPVHVDNKELGEFLSGIIEMGGCRDRTCDDCGYCHQWSENAVTVNEQSRDEILKDQPDLTESVRSGGQAHRENRGSWYRRWRTGGSRDGDPRRRKGIFGKALRSSNAPHRQGLW